MPTSAEAVPSQTTAVASPEAEFRVAEATPEFRVAPETKESERKSELVLTDLGKDLLVQAARFRDILTVDPKKEPDSMKVAKKGNMARRIEVRLQKFDELAKKAQKEGGFDQEVAAQLAKNQTQMRTEGLPQDVLEAFPALAKMDKREAVEIFELWSKFVGHQATDMDAGPIQPVLEDSKFGKIEFPTFERVLEIATKGLDKSSGLVPLNTEALLAREKAAQDGAEIWNEGVDLKKEAVDPNLKLAYRNQEKNWDWIGKVGQEDLHRPEMTEAEKRALLVDWLAYLGRKSDWYELQKWDFDPQAERKAAMIALVIGEKPPPIPGQGTNWNEIGHYLLHGRPLGGRPHGIITIPELRELTIAFNEDFTTSGEPAPAVKIQEQHISDFTNQVYRMYQELYYKYSNIAIQEMSWLEQEVVDFLYDHIKKDFTATAGHAADWETARDQSQSIGFEMLKHITELFHREDVDKDGNWFFPVAEAFRLLNVYRINRDKKDKPIPLYTDPRNGEHYFAYVDATAEKRDILMRMIAWKLYGDDTNTAWQKAVTPPPGMINMAEIDAMHNPTGEHRNPPMTGVFQHMFNAWYAEKIAKMTWLTSEWGANDPYYAWRTHNFIDSLANQEYVHPIFRSGRGRELLSKHFLHIESFWERLATHIDRDAERIDRLPMEEWPSVKAGLRVIIPVGRFHRPGAKPKVAMAKDFTHLQAQLIDFTDVRRSIFPIIAAQGARADKMRNLAAKKGNFLNRPNLRNFLQLAVQVEILEDLNPLNKAIAMCEFFSFLADFHLSESEQLSKPDFRLPRAFDDDLTLLRDSLNFKDKANGKRIRQMYEAVERKYQKHPLVEIYM